MSAVDTIEVANLRSIDDLVELDRKFASAKEALRIDFREVQRASPKWVEILSNLLLTEWSRHAIDVLLPGEPRAANDLERGGLLFALAQRETLTLIDGTEAHTVLGAWARQWTPHNQNYQLELEIGQTDRIPPDLSVRPERTQTGRMALFVNPHARAREEVLIDEVGREAAEPWIAGVVETVAKTMSTAERKELSRKLSRLLREMISNVEHAFRPVTGPFGTVPSRLRKSYVQLYYTFGGGEDSHNRLHLVVGDSGLGVVRTLRPKLAAADDRYESPDGEKSDERIVKELLSGELPHFGQASGLGYETIRDVASELGGRIDLVTGSVDSNNVRTSIVAHLDRDGSVKSVWHPALGISGTVAHATLPMG